MATTYINTGVLGQVLGGSLGTAGLGQRYQEFASDVQRKKRSLSGPTRQEREALRQRRQERIAAAEEAVGVAVDTADIKVPAIPVEKDASPEVQQQQQAQNIAASKLGITKVPEVAKTPVAPSPQAVAPEKSYTEKDVAFVRSFEDLYQNISTKNQSDVRSGAGTLQAQYDAALRAAQASGRAEFVSAIQGIQGIAGQRHISAQNVGQAKATSGAARAAIRGVVDIDQILREQQAVFNQSRVTTTALPTPVTQVARRYSNPFRRGY